MQLINVNSSLKQYKTKLFSNYFDAHWFFSSLDGVSYMCIGNILNVIILNVNMLLDKIL